MHGSEPRGDRAESARDQVRYATLIGFADGRGTAAGADDPAYTAGVDGVDSIDSVDSDDATPARRIPSAPADRSSGATRHAAPTGAPPGPRRARLVAATVVLLLAGAAVLRLVIGRSLTAPVAVPAPLAAQRASAALAAASLLTARSELAAASAQSPGADAPAGAAAPIAAPTGGSRPDEADRSGSPLHLPTSSAAPAGIGDPMPPSATRATRATNLASAANPTPPPSAPRAAGARALELDRLASTARKASVAAVQAPGARLPEPFRSIPVPAATDPGRPGSAPRAPSMAPPLLPASAAAPPPIPDTIEGEAPPRADGDALAQLQVNGSLRTLDASNAPFDLIRIRLSAAPRQAMLAPRPSDPLHPAAWYDLGQSPAPGWTLTRIENDFVELMTPHANLVRLLRHDAP